MKESENIALNRLLEKTQISPSEMGNIIEFYRTILELERIKEPDIKTYYPYPLNFKEDDPDVMLIDLPCNFEFLKAFFHNKESKFTQDLYVGLSIISKGCPQTVSFSLTIAYEDLRGFDPYENLLPIRLSSLSIDSRVIDQLELDAQKISEIDNQLGQLKNISELHNLVKNQFGDDVTLKSELLLALSSKNIALAQISAELKKINSFMVENNDLLSHFLSHSQFVNLITPISVDELIPITDMDHSQASVVAHALSNRFSVITGAPGTGKTQVILNIIANALMRDKSVLVASKNNKAVDNVKERFDLIDPSKYLLRFGSKELIKNQTLPALAQIINRLGGIKSQPNTLSSLLRQYEDIKASVKEAKSKLARIEELKAALPKLIADKTTIESQIQNENQRFTDSITAIRDNYEDILHLDNIPTISVDNSLRDFTSLRSSLECKYLGMLRFWHNFFSKKRDAKNYIDCFTSLPHSVQADLNAKDIKISIDSFDNGNAIITECSMVISLLKRIVEYNRSIQQATTSHSRITARLNASLASLNRKYQSDASEYEDLTSKKIGLIHAIVQAKTSLNNLGPRLVAAKIDHIQRTDGVAQKISSYKACIPDCIPWKAEDLMRFTVISQQFLSVCRLISTTSLSVKSGYPLTANLFDILIIDEASQCDVASAIPLVLRAKQVVIIGDPKQLKHITSVKEDEEKATREYLGLSHKPHLKYVHQSLWDYSADFLAHANQNSSPIALENHYRCHHDIIGYSNMYFYGPFLSKPLNVRTDESLMTLPQTGIVMINVHGKQESNNINANHIEGDRCISLAKEILSLNAGISIGIVTPFRDQVGYIKSHLDESLRGIIEVNTAHGFQGDEKDVMIYSLVVTDNSPKSKIRWIDECEPNLVNVAVTRARQTLYVVGNADYIKLASPEHKALGFLIRYAQSKTK